MATPKSVKICINGMFYPIATSEPAEYVLGIAQELDEQVRMLMAKNPSISFNDVMVLCCVNYADAYKRGEENADRMRAQITEYLEDAAKARIELDEVKRENAHLRRQLDGQEMKGQTKLGAAAAKAAVAQTKIDALGQTKLDTIATAAARADSRASTKPDVQGKDTNARASAKSDDSGKSNPTPKQADSPAVKGASSAVKSDAASEQIATDDDSKQDAR